MLSHYLWKVKVQICGKLRTRWTFSQVVMVSVGISKLGIRDLIFVHPGAKINGSYYQVINISWVGCPSIYWCCHIRLSTVSVKMSLSELLWHNQFERFSHHTRIRPEGVGFVRTQRTPWIHHDVVTRFVCLHLSTTGLKLGLAHCHR